ncbi:MAG: hypothetical protein Q9164_007685 [Protoblastenia rupestris]
MPLAFILTTCLLTLVSAGGFDCFRYVHGGPPAYNPLVQNCRNAIQRIRSEAVRDPNAQVFDSTGIHARKLPYTWFAHDCAIMINTESYPQPSGRLALSLRAVADKAESLVSSCLVQRGWRLGGEATMDHGVVVSVAGSYPATLATAYYSDGLEGMEPAMDNSTELASATEPVPTTLIPVMSQGAATF